MERLDDPSRLVVLLARELFPVHHGARVELRMVVVGERDRRERLLVNSVLIHEAARPQRYPLRGHVKAVRRGIRTGARDVLVDGSLAEASKLALGECAKRDHVLRVAGDQRRGGIANRRGTATASSPPYHSSKAHLLEPERGREARRFVTVVGVSGNSVDIANVDSRVFSGFDNRLAREPKLAHRRLSAPVILRLAQTYNRDLVLDRILVHRHLSVAV